MAEAVHVWGAGGVWKLSVLSAKYCCELKTALKNKVYVKGEKTSAFHFETYITNIDLALEKHGFWNLYLP